MAKSKKDTGQLFFDFDDTYVEEVKKSNNTKPQNVLPIGTEIVFNDPVFNKEEKGRIIKWDGNQIQTQIGHRIFNIVESDILEVIKQNEQVIHEDEQVLVTDDITINNQKTDVSALSNDSTTTIAQPVSFDNNYNAFGAWIDFGRQLSVKQREEANRNAQEILIHSRENLTEADFSVLRKYSGWGWRTNR